MSRLKNTWRIVIAAAVVAGLAAGAGAQTIPHIAYVYPAGGRQGTNFKVTVGGQYLNNVSFATISGKGIETKVLERNKPLSNKEFNTLRDRAKELGQKKMEAARAGAQSNGGRGGLLRAMTTFRSGWTAADEKELEEIRMKIEKNPPNRLANPALVETVILEVTLAPESEPGDRELRLMAPNGVSNPLIFCVGQLPEYCENEERVLMSPNGPVKLKSNPNAVLLDTAPQNGVLRDTTPKNAGKAKNFRKNGTSAQNARAANKTAKPFQTAKPTPAKPGAKPAATTGKTFPKKGNYQKGAKKNVKEPPLPPEPDPTIKPEMDISVPGIVNGQIMPGDVDRFRFKAKKGEHLVMVVSARGLIPYLPDGVPGWFQATLALYDAQGRELAYDDDYRFKPDPVLYYEIPADGDYIIEIKDSIYRGREDFVYRIAMGELPFVTGIFPLGGRVGESNTIELKGWNLPVKRLTLNANEPGVYLVSTDRSTRFYSRVPFALDNLEECREKEPNNKAGEAQKVTAPIVINGRIGEAGDQDVYTFEGKAGDYVVAEVMARRLDSPLDSLLRLTDASGKQIACNDDREDKSTGLNTHHADSWLSATLPSAGVYTLTLTDVQKQGGDDYAYRLRISPPRHDFELRVVPSAINARAGAIVPITVYALRKDGFKGDISIALKDAPAGFVLNGGWVPAGQEMVRMTLMMPTAPQPQPYMLNLEGRTWIAGREIVHTAMPAEDMMQAFFYRHLVPAKDLVVDVLGRQSYKNNVRILGASPVKIPSGGTVSVQVLVNTYVGKAQLELSEPPDGITIKGVTPNKMGALIMLASDGVKAKPGQKGNLIVSAFSTPSADGKTKKTASTQRRSPIGILPAIPYEVVAN